MSIQPCARSLYAASAPRPSRPSETPRTAMDAAPRPEFSRRVGRRVGASPGWLTEEQAAAAVGRRRRPPGRAPGRRDRQPPGPVDDRARPRPPGGAARRVVAIDPFVDGRLFGGATTRDMLRAEHRRGRADRRRRAARRVQHPRPTRLVARRSTYLYIDGKHDYWTLSDDLRWSRAPARGRAGARPRLLLLDRRHARHPRARAAVAHAALRAPGRLAGAASGSAARRRATGCGSSRELPWWLRNVAIKVLLRLRLRPVAARVFGHDSPYDPY